MDAASVAVAISRGLQRSRLNCICTCFPVGDGGDGTGKLMTGMLKGEEVHVKARDPFGREICASYGLVDNGKTAVIEMAEASGLRLMTRDKLNPIMSSSFGTGELISDALDRGVRKIVVAMGGSATVDGGAGILAALGARFLNAAGECFHPVPANIADLGHLDLSGLDRRLSGVKVTVMCDVKNRLLGPKGASAMFGPQKGAAGKDIVVLEAALGKLRNFCLELTGRDMAVMEGGGTAGGAAAGLCGFLNAELVHGIDFYLDATGFNQVLNEAGLVITGEGSIEEQTLEGKAPLGVAARAKSRGIPVIALAGKVPVVRNQELSRHFDVLLAIGNTPTDLENALKDTEGNLLRVAEDLGNLLAIGFKTN